MISILLPTYNASRTIRHSIMSILNQTFSKFELLVLDDGSTDTTADVVHSFQDGRIRYISLPHQGLALTLNEGLRSAQYDVIARMDADDISMPTWLEEQYRVLLPANINTIVSCNYAVFRNGSIQYIIHGSESSREIKKRLALHTDIPHPGVMYFKNFIVQSGMYHNVPLEDYELWLRIKDRTEFIIQNKVLLLVGYSSASLTNRDIRRRYRNHYLIQEPYYVNLKKEFGLQTQDEESLVRGWREYFYGDCSRGRRNWKRLGLRIFYYPRVVLAYLLSYAPVSMLVTIKELRMKQRLCYYISFFSNESISIRNELGKHSA
jgi:glycosyltransferase involved in cell wall biosynthesis